MESTGCPLNLSLKVEEQEEEIQSRALESGPTDTQKVRICSEGGWVPALFDEVAIYFSDEEWDVLTEPQRALYREVMRMNYDTVLSLEFPFPKPDVISRLEGEGEAQDCDGWQFPGGTFTERGRGRQARRLGGRRLPAPRATARHLPAPRAAAPGRLRPPPAPRLRRAARVERGVPLLHGHGLPGVRPRGRRAGRQVPAQPRDAPQLRRGLQADGGGVRREHQQLPGGQAVRRAGEERPRLAQGEAAAAERPRHAARLPRPQERPLRPGGPARGRVRALHAGQGGPDHQGGHAAEGAGDRAGDEHPREGLQGQPGLVSPDDAQVRPVPEAQGPGAPAAARGPDGEAGHLPAQRAGAAQGARLPGGPDGERRRDAHLPGGAVQGDGGQPGREAGAGQDARPGEAEDHGDARGAGRRPQAAALHRPEGHVHPARQVPQRHGNPLPPVRLDDRGPDAGLAGGGVAAAGGRAAQAAGHADRQRLPRPRHRLGEEPHGEHGHRHGGHPRRPDLAAAGAGRGGVQAAQRQRAGAVLQLAAGRQPGAQPHRQRQEAAPRPLPGVGHGRVEQHLQRLHRPGLQEVPHLQRLGGRGRRPVGDRERAAGGRGAAQRVRRREPLKGREWNCPKQPGRTLRKIPRRVGAQGAGPGTVRPAPHPRHVRNAWDPSSRQRRDWGRNCFCPVS